MILIIKIIIGCIGFYLLARGAELLIDGASNVAFHFKLPKLLIGLTIVAFGTSLPELSVAFQTIFTGSPDIAFGNTIGSSIANILLILGLSAIIRPIKIKEETITDELPMLLMITLIFTTLLSDVLLNNGTFNMFSRADALIVLLVFGVFVSYLIKKSITKDDKNKEKPKYRLSSSFLLIIMGLLSLFIGSDLVVDSVESIAEAFHISQRIISLTVVTIGTSLPEIITAIIASRKNETEILLGNIIGSNIFNICIVLGIPILIYGNVMHITVNILDIAMSLLSAGLLFVFSYFDRTITRVNGIIMILLYLLYFSLILII